MTFFKSRFAKLWAMVQYELHRKMSFKKLRFGDTVSLHTSRYSGAAIVDSGKNKGAQSAE